MKQPAIVTYNHSPSISEVQDFSSRGSEGVSLHQHLDQEMDGVAVRETKEMPQERLAKGLSLAKLSTEDVGNDRISCSWRAQAASPRTGYMTRGAGGFSRQGSRSTRGLRAEMAAFGDRFRRREGKKEILRRALTPPAKRPTLRWLDFRPTPSRLCNMSMA